MTLNRARNYWGLPMTLDRHCVILGVIAEVMSGQRLAANHDAMTVMTHKFKLRSQDDCFRTVTTSDNPSLFLSVIASLKDRNSVKVRHFPASSDDGPLKTSVIASSSCVIAAASGCKLPHSWAAVGLASPAACPPSLRQARIGAGSVTPTLAP